MTKLLPDGRLSVRMGALCREHLLRVVGARMHIDSRIRPGRVIGRTHTFTYVRTMTTRIGP